MGRDHSSYDNAKPSPKAMVEFAEELGVEPREIVYVGDSVSDYISAHGAGATFVAVTSGKVDETMWMKVDPNLTVLTYAGQAIELLKG